MLTFENINTRGMVVDLRDMSKRVAEHAKQLLKDNFGGTIKDKSKSGTTIMICDCQYEDGNASATVELRLELNVTDPKVNILEVSGKIEGDKEAEKKYRKVCIDAAFKVKGKMDGVLSELKEEKVQEYLKSGKLPKALTDDEWKRVKDMTLGDTGLGKVLRAWEEKWAKLEKSKEHDLRFFDFDDAAKALSDVVQAIVLTKDKAAGSFYQNSYRAAERLGTLVEEAKAEVAKRRKSHTEFVEQWEKERIESSKKPMYLHELDVRGFVSKGVEQITKAINEAKTDPLKKESAVKLAKLGVNELKRLQSLATNFFNDFLRDCQASGSPQTADWTEEFKKYIKELKGQLVKINELVKTNCELVVQASDDLVKG